VGWRLHAGEPAQGRRSVAAGSACGQQAKEAEGGGVVMRILKAKRKMDAVAVFEWMQESGWDGSGDYEGTFMNWAHATQYPVWHSFKGEI
jgi:hypothetical protein